MAAGASGEESAWHDLIANFAAEPDRAGGEPPWPDRENLPTPSHASPAADTGPDTDPDLRLELTEDSDSEFDFGTGPGGRSGRWSSQPRIIRPASPVPPPPPASASPSSPSSASSSASGSGSEEGDFVPPVPPPLPTLDPVTKGAWAALFGGPAYLLIATMASWAVPGWAAFLAVAAFVAGFATLVIRMGDRPPRDSGPDDGAVL
ncbi:MAG TPA: hypothetical protein VIP48_21735 [Streptosporangiaceae bacterium]